MPFALSMLRSEWWNTLEISWWYVYSACVCLCVGLANVIELRLLIDVNNAILDCCISLSLSPSFPLSLFTQGGYMTSEQVSLIRKQLYSLLQTIRKEAVPLVDAFDIPDEILNSVLGRYDGNVYTHLYEWALKAPRNKKQVRVQ